MLQLLSIGKAFGEGRWVLREVTFRVNPGEIVCLVGRSGCGKTTVLRLAAGLEAATEGEARRTPGVEMGYVFQEPNLLPWLTAAENIALPARLRGDGAWERREAARQGAEVVGLAAEDGAKYPHELSLGMRMRVALARALSVGRDLLLLDEPFSALDALAREGLAEELSGLQARVGCGALLVTHSLAEAVFLGQRVVFLAGEPTTVAATMEVPLERPRTAGTRTEPKYQELVAEAQRIFLQVNGRR